MKRVLETELTTDNVGSEEEILPNEVTQKILLLKNERDDQIQTMKEYRNVVDMLLLNKCWFHRMMTYMKNEVVLVSHEILNKMNDEQLFQFKQLREMMLPLLHFNNVGYRAYAIRNYGLNSNFNFDQSDFNRYKEDYPDYRPITKDMLKNFGSLTCLTLNCDSYYSGIIDNEHWKYLSNLVTLKIGSGLSSSQTVLNSDQLIHLRRLKIFNNGTSYGLSDSSICGLTGLRELYIDTDCVSDVGIWNMIHLEVLRVSNTRRNNTITDQALSRLVNLKKLVINSNDITDSSLSCLTNLEHLSINYAGMITDTSLGRLEKLKILSLHGCVDVHGLSLPFLKNVTHLRLSDFSRDISDNSLGKMIQLKHLELQNNNSITSSGLTTLINLELLDIQEDRLIDGEGFENLTQLRHINLIDKANFSLDCLSRMKSLSSVFIDLEEVEQCDVKNFCEKNHIHLCDGWTDFDFEKGRPIIVYQ